MPSVQSRTLIKQKVEKAKIPLYLCNENSCVLKLGNYPVEKEEKNGKKFTEKKKNIFSFKWIILEVFCFVIFSGSELSVCLQFVLSVLKVAIAGSN